MQRTRFGKWIVLACMGALAACTSEGGTGSVSGTQVNLTVGQGDQAFDVDRVDYVVVCGGEDTDASDTPGNSAAIDDETTFSGQFEIVGDLVFQALMDLPPGDCTITLSVSDADEVVCMGTQTLPVTADQTQVFNIALRCAVSFQSPVGDADVNGTFFTVVGNFCPSLYVFNAIPTVHPIDGDGTSDLQLRALDFDGTCGESCDPDGNDPGLTTTVNCDAGSLVGGSGDGSNSDNYVLTCTAPGPVTCTAAVTDGDLDCDKQKVLTVTCPGVNPCDGNPCDDTNDCTGDVCTPIDETNFTCANPNLPADTVCVAPGGGLCDGNGVCVAQGCLVDADCDQDGNECTVPPAGACQVDGSCLAEVNVADDTSCDSGAGTCQSGACVTTVCTVDGDCDDSNPCTADSCDTGVPGGACVNTPTDGAVCDISGNPGTCNQDVCELDPFDPDPITRTVPVACSNNVAPQLSQLAFDLTVDPGVIQAGQAFNAEITGVLQFDQAFLQAALGFVPGLLTADVIGARASVGARGAVVDPLTNDGGVDTDNQQTFVPAPGSACTSAGTEPFCNLPIPQIPNFGYPGTGQPCAQDTDCIWNALGATCVSNACTAAATPLPCATNADCPLFGVATAFNPAVDGTGGQQCVANACEEFACTGPGAVLAGGEQCFSGSDCPGFAFGQTCDAAVTFTCNPLDCQDGSCNLCTPLVVAGISVPYGPTPGAGSWTAGAAGGQICFDYGGNAEAGGGPNLILINADAGGILATLGCQGGTLDPACPETCPVDNANILDNPEDPAVLPCFDVQP